MYLSGSTCIDFIFEMIKFLKILEKLNSIKAVRNKHGNFFVLHNKKEFLEMTLMSQFPPLHYNYFFLNKFNFRDWIFHSVVICGPELYKQHGKMKMRP